MVGILKDLPHGRTAPLLTNVWAALEQGGKVILLRHTHVDIQEGIGRLAPGNCAAEVNLSASGVEQAERIGKMFRAHGIAIGEVLASPYCRCMDTGRLAIGHATAGAKVDRSDNPLISPTDT